MADSKDTKKTSKKIEQLLLDLQIPSKTASALDSLQIYGNASIIRPLFEFVLANQHPKSSGEVIEFLSNLKDSSSMQEVLNCLIDQKFKSLKREILSTIWNSPLDYSDFLALFVKMGVEDDFLITLECLTIIENLDGPFEEKSLLESQLYLSEYHEGKHPKSSEKDQLISEIAILIKDFDRDVEA